MEIGDALELLKAHTGENISDGEPESSIADAEAKLGIKFPSSYRLFLEKLGYAEIHGDEIYSIYEDDDASCLGIVQQNMASSLLTQGFLAVLSTDIDGTFYLNLNDGSAYLNGPDSRIADSFEELIYKLLEQDS